MCPICETVELSPYLLSKWSVEGVGKGNECSNQQHDDQLFKPSGTIGHTRGHWALGVKPCAWMGLDWSGVVQSSELRVWTLNARRPFLFAFSLWYKYVAWETTCFEICTDSTDEKKKSSQTFPISQFKESHLHRWVCFKACMLCLENHRNDIGHS